ncbi:MAG: hypothetical protein AAF531_27625, partial [Actinomycetota bacterium]
AAYVVAVDRSGGGLVGLCRFWRNADGPALGLVGVLPGHRSGRPAVALVHRAMTAASRWGWAGFRTHTARVSLQRKLMAIGATETGGLLRLRRDG